MQYYVMPTEGDASLLVITGDEIRILYFGSNVYDVIAKDVPNPFAITFDGLHVYWATAKEGYEALYRSTEVGTSVELLFTAGSFLFLVDSAIRIGTVFNPMKVFCQIPTYLVEGIFSCVSILTPEQPNDSPASERDS